MSEAPRLFRTWIQGVTDLGLGEELNAFELADRIKATREANEEAYKHSARAAEIACAEAGVERDEHGFLQAPNALLIPPDLPAHVARAYRALIDRDILRARQRKARADFSDRCECAGAALLEAAKRGALQIKGKPDETARISLLMDPCEVEFLDWNMSMIDNWLQNYEQAFYWRQVTIDEGQYQNLKAPAPKGALPSLHLDRAASLRKPKVAGDLRRLTKLLLQLYPDGDPVAVTGLGTDVVLDACKEQ